MVVLVRIAAAGRGLLYTSASFSGQSDFASQKQNRVPTGMLRAPIGNPASKEIAPLCTPLVLVAYEDATISQLAHS